MAAIVGSIIENYFLAPGDRPVLKRSSRLAAAGLRRLSHKILRHKPYFARAFSCSFQAACLSAEASESDASSTCALPSARIVEIGRAGLRLFESQRILGPRRRQVTAPAQRLRRQDQRAFSLGPDLELIDAGREIGNWLCGLLPNGRRQTSAASAHLSAVCGSLSASTRSRRHKAAQAECATRRRRFCVQSSCLRGLRTLGPQLGRRKPVNGGAGEEKHGRQNGWIAVVPHGSPGR